MHLHYEERDDSCRKKVARAHNNEDLPLSSWTSTEPTKSYCRGSELYGSARIEAGSNAQLPSGVLSFDFSDSASEQGARRIESGHVSW